MKKMKMRRMRSIQASCFPMVFLGRVFYLIGFGADPTGKQDSSDAFLQGLNDAFHAQNGLDLLPVVHDLGRLEIDLQSGDYKISKPFRFPPSGANVVGVLVKSNPGASSLSRMDNCYLDYISIVMEDPVQVHVTNGFFLGDANVVIKSVHCTVSGLNIVDNMFNGNPHNEILTVILDGEFWNIDQVVIDRNNVNGMSLKSTVGRLTVPGTGTKWVANFSLIFVFPNRIVNLHYSFYLKGGQTSAFTVHAVTSMSSNMVVVKSSVKVNGVVSIVVDL
ncbi:hypothetical protein SLEP1_g34210 [Rubroshorea leprosula]|uniref:Polygalacturonase n=1 Tax=Rubroshorea leprosula TaxID=152421 RepID=A0AAV5KJ43_9ROSI|nr:hypothetical protein SLEP1_g34210 [Rubroshorea leprosula]